MGLWKKCADSFGGTICVSYGQDGWPGGSGNIIAIRAFGVLSALSIAFAALVCAHWTWVRESKVQAEGVTTPNASSRFDIKRLGIIAGCYLCALVFGLICGIQVRDRTSTHWHHQW